MYAKWQTFIIVILTYSFYGVLANENGTCDCDVLEINSPASLFGHQNFTKQNDVLNEKPYYISNKLYRISWDGQYWSYDKYNALFNKFEPENKSYATKSFNFENNCNDVSVSISWGMGEYFVLKKTI